MDFPAIKTDRTPLNHLNSRYDTWMDSSQINALKNKKLNIRKTILSSVIEAKKEIETRLKK
jgi:hypothetical protein